MDTPFSSERLLRVTAHTFEETAFVFAEPDDAPRPFAGPVSEVRLEFQGLRHGRLTLASTPAFGVELATNMLGIDPSDPAIPESADAALREIVNILCGVVAEELSGRGVLCELGLPVLQVVTPERVEVLRREATYSVILLAGEGHRVDVMVFEGEAV